MDPSKDVGAIQWNIKLVLFLDFLIDFLHHPKVG